MASSTKVGAADCAAADRDHPDKLEHVLVACYTSGVAAGGPLSEPHLRFDRDGHVAIVTMNRPEARNAWSLEMMARMADAWAEIDGDREIRCAVLTGAGTTFCAGADLKLMHSDRSGDPWHARFRAEPELHWRSMLRSQRLEKPLVAAVEGYALGGGTEILLATDLRIAANNATFGLTEAKHALFPLGGSTVRLRRQIPQVHAMDMLLTGRRVSAAEALSWGLINRTVEPGQALGEALAVARAIAANGPIAVQAIRRSALASDGLTEADGLALELQHGQPVFRTQDAKEGPRAFAERREPRFTGE